MKNTAMVGINITAKRGRIVRACISIRFSPITRVNIVVSYIIYIYYNKEKEALKVWEIYDNPYVSIDRYCCSFCYL